MIKAYLVDPIQIKYITSRDEWNEPTYSTADVMGYVDWRTRLVRDLRGEEVISKGTVYLEWDGTLTEEARIIIRGIEHSIISIVEMKDFSVSHYEVAIA